MKLRRAIGAGAAACVAAALLAVGGGAALSLLLYGAVAAAAVVLWPWVRRLQLPPLVLELATPLLVAAFTLSLTPWLVHLDPPATHDHPLHVFKIWQTWKLLGTGRLLGWSDLLDAGIPQNHLYPPGAAYLACLFKAMSLGALSFEQVHALTLVAAVLALPLGIYALARRPLGRLPAALAAALAPIEGGSFFQGGFHFTLFWGVFASALAVGLALASLGALHRYAMRGGAGALSAAALALAGAILCHPLALILVLLFAPLRALQAALAPGPGDDPSVPPATVAVRTGQGLALGLGLSAFFLVPFATDGARWAIHVGYEWIELGDMVGGLFNGTTLHGVIPAFVGAGLLGLLAAALSGRRFELVAGAVMSLSLLLGSKDAMGTLGLQRLFSTFDALQTERFAYFIKAMLWIGVGSLLSMALERMRPLQNKERWVAGALAGALVAPLAFTAPKARPDHWFPPLPLESRDPAAGESRRAAARIAERASAIGPGRILLVGYNQDDHNLSALPVHADLPAARIGYPATELFNGVVGSMDPAVLDLQGVRFIAKKSSDAVPGFRSVDHLGAVWLFERDGAQPERARVEGGGTAHVTRFEDGEVVVEVKDAAPGARLIVGVAAFGGWSAQSGGEKVEPERAFIGDVPFLSVPARDGITTFRYRGTAAAHAGAALSLLSLAALGLALSGRRLPRPSWALRLAPAVPSLALAAVGATSLLLAARALFPPGPWALREHLEHALVWRAGRPCAALPGSGGFSCDGRPSVRRGLINSRWFAQSCVLVDGPTVIAADVPMGRGLWVRLAQNDASAGEIRTTVSAGDLPPVELKVDRNYVTERIDTSELAGRTARVTFEVPVLMSPVCLAASVDP